MTDRERILNALPESVEVPTSPPPYGNSPGGDSDLWEAFRCRLLDLGGEWANATDLPQLVSGSGWVDAGAASLLKRHSVDLAANAPSDPWTVEWAVTMADMAIAESGSVVVSAGPHTSRLASLAPPTHVALVQTSNIVPNLEMAMSRMGDRTSVIITGPSRTADIEGILVRGIHGPGRLIVVRL